MASSRPSARKRRKAAPPSRTSRRRFPERRATLHELFRRSSHDTGMNISARSFGSAWAASVGLGYAAAAVAATVVSTESFGAVLTVALVEGLTLGFLQRPLLRRVL